MRAAQAAGTPLASVERWPWHKAVAVWIEARNIHDERYQRSWEPLLRVWYREND